MNQKTSQHILNTISGAIQRSDKSLFFESYHKQARTVIKDLQKAGYVVAPQIPSQDSLDKAAAVLKDGRHRPHDVIKNIYQNLISPFIP